MALLAGFPYDLVVLDIMLPGHNGFEIVERLRGGSQKVPVLMLTAQGGVEDRVKGLELVEKLLLLARTEAGQGFHLETVALDEIAFDTGELMRPLFDDKGLKLELPATRINPPPRPVSQPIPELERTHHV